MTLKTKLILGTALLVLVVVLAVNLVSLAGAVRTQMRQVNTNADSVAHQIYNEAYHELEQANASGRIEAARPQTLREFFNGLGESDAMQSLFSSAIGYGSNAVRDVALVTPQDEVVADSNPSLVGNAQPARPPLSELAEAGSLRQLAAIFGPDRVYESRLGVEVRRGGAAQPLGTIRIGVDTVLLRSALLPAMRSLALSGALLVLLSTVVAAGVSGVVLRPLTALSAQLDRLMSARAGDAGPAEPALLSRRDEIGEVAGKIQRLGRQVEDVRQVYSTLQENVSHVLDRIEEGVLLFDQAGLCVMASAAVPALLGIAAGEIAGRPAAALFPDSSPLDTAVRTALARGAAMSSTELERSHGAALLVRLDRVRARGGQEGALLTLRAAAPVRRIDDELELARRLAAIGRLSRGVAHEVKNPLNAITIHLELLRQKAGRGADSVQPHVGVIRREIERLDRVVKTFLDFTRPVELQLAPLDLGELVRGVGQLVSAGAQANGIALEARTSPRGPLVWADRDLIEQVLLNLINNGLQAVGMQPGGPRLLTIEVFLLEGRPAVRVRDSGPGVAEEIRERIFDLYFTTRSEGTGIGLALAARIMELHDGKLVLEDNPGGGASFLLQFHHRAHPQVVPEHAGARA